MIDFLESVLQSAREQLDILLGLDREVEDVNSIQMALRTLVVYVLALLMVRIASKRLLSQATAFDVIVAIMLGSILSRAINGSAPLLPTVLAGGALIALHGVFAALAARTSFFGPLVKGEPRLLIKDGQVQEEEMRQAKLSRHDLEQALRLEKGHEDPARIRRAYLERNGRISFIPFEKETLGLDGATEQGVQSIRPSPE